MLDRLLVPKTPFQNEFFSIQSVFGIDGVLGKTTKEIDRVYRQKQQGRPFDLRTFFAWKVLRDPYYKTLVPRLKSFQPLYDAGFFLDRLTVEEVDTLAFQPGECRTPISQVSQNLSKLKKGARPVVLLTTGAFSPIHNGHIDMMIKARETLERKGYQVIGGYFSPSHDEYVSKKYNGEADFPAAHRVYLCQIAVSDSDWLFADPWEARYLPTDVNFTDVIARLEAYLNFYLKTKVPIQVAYVFGADNAAFSHAFGEKGISVCIARSRQGAQKLASVQRASRGSKNFFVTAQGGISDISSTSVRRWKLGSVPENVARTYFGWRLNQLREIENVPSPKKFYVLRDDRTWSLQPWRSKVAAQALEKAGDAFFENLKNLLVQSFRRTAQPDRSEHIDIVTYPLEQQSSYVKALAKKERLLNLDICTNEKLPGAVQISRAFFLCNGQVRAEQLVPRPGFPSIEKQLDTLAPGAYTLIDDDIASGSTMSMLMAMLPEGIRVKKIKTLTEYSHSSFLNSHLHTENAEIYDMVDFRDFLFGSKAGGLVIRLPDGTDVRAPYSLPYISLVTRAKIPPSTELLFSKEIWRLNHDFFSSLNVELRIKDTDPSFQKFCRYLKFPPSMPMVDFCAWHLSRMLKYV